MPTCSQITDALNTLASATTDPNILNDLSGETADLTVANGSLTAVQLSAGGQALLTVPSSASISGKVFRVVVCFKVVPTVAEGSNDVTLRMTIGDPHTSGNTVSTQDITIPNSITYENGMIVFTGSWDSSSERLIGFDNSSSPFSPFAVVAQNDLQFGLWANTSGPATDPQNVLTVTQFKIELV